MMSVFDRLMVKGYRRLASVDIELRPLTVLIGPNGAGKTSTLEILSLVSASARGELNQELSNLGGLNSVLTLGRADSLELSLHGPAERGPMEYEFKVARSGTGYDIPHETLSEDFDPKRPPFNHIEVRGPDVHYYEVGSSDVVRPNWKYNPFETALSQVPKMYIEPESLRSELASLIYYKPLYVHQGSAVRVPQTMRPASLPGEHGETLVSCLYYMRETDPDRFELVKDTLKAGFPTFRDLGFPPVAAGTLALAWKEHDFASAMNAHQLSDGTLRFLWLATLLLSRGVTALTLIDEPELSLHPALISLLADLLREASRRTQVIVATQSDRLVRFLKAKEVLVCDIHGEEDVTMTWADSMDLERWLADYSLDELWSMNILGGRP